MVQRPVQSPPTVLSLFSGLGGLDLGLEAAGFASVGCVEIDPMARSSLKRNRGDVWPVLAPNDVVDFARDVLTMFQAGEVDLVAGAPPCQPFSKAGQWQSTARRGLDDDRGGRLLSAVLEVATALQPKAVLLENVPGFVSGPTSALSRLELEVGKLSAATGLDYGIEVRVLDAHQYGIPQRRRRAIVILGRKGFPWSWPDPQPECDRPVAWDAIGQLSLSPEQLRPPKGKWASLLPTIPEGKNYQYHTPRGEGGDLFGYRTRYWSFLLKLAKSKPSWTLPASPGPATGPFHWDSRPLTVEETLRLQSFPADWIVEGTYRDQVRQVGNATPPALAEAIGRELAQALGVVSETSPRYAMRRRGHIPPPAPPAPLPSEFKSGRRRLRAHPGTGKGPAPRSK